MPLPVGLVVKNGSNTLEITSGGIPSPTSETTISTWPMLPSAWRFFAVTVTVPPFGIASRALRTRFTSATSNSAGSATMGHVCRIDLNHKMNRRAGAAVQHIRKHGNAVSHVNRLRIEMLSPCKAEKLLGEGTTSLRRPLDRLQGPYRARIASGRFPRACALPEMIISKLLKS